MIITFFIPGIKRQEEILIMIILAPSILEQILNGSASRYKCDRAGAPYIHLDIMNFCPVFHLACL